MNQVEFEKLLDQFRDSYLIVRTGKDKQGNCFNTIGQTNQACWMGEHIGPLIEELDKRKALLDVLKSSIHKQANYFNHLAGAKTRLSETDKLQAELLACKFAIRSLLHDLPSKRDWLDPELERTLKELAGPETLGEDMKGLIESVSVRESLEGLAKSMADEVRYGGAFQRLKLKE